MLHKSQEKKPENLQINFSPFAYFISLSKFKLFAWCVSERFANKRKSLS